MEADPATGDSRLHIACRIGTDEDVSCLLEQGARVNTPNKSRSTPLHVAARHGSWRMVQMLISHGARLDPRDNRGRTPVLLAVKHAHLRAALVLIAAGADVSFPDAIGNLPLHAAAESNHVQLLPALLAHTRAQVDARNAQGRTALMLAAERNHCETVTSLLRAGANPAMRDNTNRTAGQLCLRDCATKRVLPYSLALCSLTNYDCRGHHAHADEAEGTGAAGSAIRGGDRGRVEISAGGGSSRQGSNGGESAGRSSRWHAGAEECDERAGETANGLMAVASMVQALQYRERERNKRDKASKTLTNLVTKRTSDAATSAPGSAPIPVPALRRSQSANLLPRSRRRPTSGSSVSRHRSGGSGIKMPVMPPLSFSPASNPASLFGDNGDDGDDDDRCSTFRVGSSSTSSSMLVHSGSSPSLFTPSSARDSLLANLLDNGDSDDPDGDELFGRRVSDVGVPGLGRRLSDVTLDSLQPVREGLDSQAPQARQPYRQQQHQYNPGLREPRQPQPQQQPQPQSQQQQQPSTSKQSKANDPNRPRPASGGMKGRNPDWDGQVLAAVDSPVPAVVERAIKGRSMQHLTREWTQADGCRVKVTTYYPRQFEALRHYFCPDPANPAEDMSQYSSSSPSAPLLSVSPPSPMSRQQQQQPQQQQPEQRQPQKELTQQPVSDDGPASKVGLSLRELIQRRQRDERDQRFRERARVLREAIDVLLPNGPGKPLGLGIRPVEAKGGTGAIVGNIKRSGAVGEWNSRSAAHMRVCNGDVLVAVEDEVVLDEPYKSILATLKRHCSTDKPFSIRISRPSSASKQQQQQQQESQRRQQQQQRQQRQHQQQNSQVEEEQHQMSFMDSLADCRRINPDAGRSGSVFFKTNDNRFVVKVFMKPVELEMFTQQRFALEYFAYMTNSWKELVTSRSTGQKRRPHPSFIVPILGMYKCQWKRGFGGGTTRYLCVMANLFAGHDVDEVLDFKRIKPSVKPFAHALDTFSMGYLFDCIKRDSHFLAYLNVMDYSLLVGVDKKNKQLVVGLIDYLRQYSMDKAMESAVKKPIASMKGEGTPTIVSPAAYRHRFLGHLSRFMPKTRLGRAAKEPNAMHHVHSSALPDPPVDGLTERGSLAQGLAIFRMVLPAHEKESYVCHWVCSENGGGKKLNASVVGALASALGRHDAERRGSSPRLLLATNRRLLRLRCDQWLVEKEINLASVGKMMMRTEIREQEQGVTLQTMQGAEEADGSDEHSAPRVASGSQKLTADNLRCYIEFTVGLRDSDMLTSSSNDTAIPSDEALGLKASVALSSLTEYSERPTPWARDALKDMQEDTARHIHGCGAQTQLMGPTSVWPDNKDATQDMRRVVHFGCSSIAQAQDIIATVHSLELAGAQRQCTSVSHE